MSTFEYPPAGDSQENLTTPNCDKDISFNANQINDIIEFANFTTRTEKEFLDVKNKNEIYPIEIEVAFQPIINKSGNVVKYECLIRPFAIHGNSNKFLLSSDKFLNYLSALEKDKEEYELYKKSIFNVIDKAIPFAKDNDINITFNFGEIEFNDDDFYLYLKTICECYNFPTNKITIEILENIQANDLDTKIGFDKLEEISTDGIRFAIDDFLHRISTQSPINLNDFSQEFKAIQNLPDNINNIIDTIKIDRKLVVSMFQKGNSGQKENFIEKNARSFFHSIFKEGIFNGKKIVFEGVEDDRLDDMLKYFKENYPNLDFYIQSFVTGMPEIDKTISQEQTDKNQLAF